MCGVVKMYIDEATDTLSRILGDSYDKADIKEAVKHIVKMSIRDPSISTDNDTLNQSDESTLVNLCDWILREKPVVAGNSTFYCQPEVEKSPTADMLRTLKHDRKNIKKQMFMYDPESDEYQKLDLDQLNAKIVQNAEYGASSNSTAAFYNKYGPAATTMMAQSVITIMAAFFESFLGNNQKFFHVNECYDWLNTVIKKDGKIPKWVTRPNVDTVNRRIRRMFAVPNTEDWPDIEAYISSLSENQLTYVYYANNLNEFIRSHVKVKNLIGNILSTLPNYEASVSGVPERFQDRFEDKESYNRWISKEMFLDPYNVPESIMKYMDELRDLLMQFIYVEYVTPDSIEKLNNHTRNTVLLVDTDSNIITTHSFVSLVLDELYPGETFGRKMLYNEMILVNIIANILSTGVDRLLDYIGRQHNMNKESRAELSMKNEFMFKRLFLMKTKKRYAASIVLREGNIIMPFKAELKGLDFIKSGVTEDVSNRFEKILCDNILFPEEVDLHNLMSDIKKFEQDIRDDLSTGGTMYLKQQQYKDQKGYATIKDSNGIVVGSRAWGIPSFTGSIIWNMIYPENKINNLDRVHVVKLIGSSPIELERIRYRYPDMYEIVIQRIFNSDEPALRNSGMKYICLPGTLKTIPEWIIPLIDIELIVSNTIGTFKSVLEALNIENVQFKTPNGNADISSALISL